MTWWQRLWHRERLESALDDELHYHFDELVAEKMRSGLPLREARREARLEFGGIEQVKEDCRDARGTRLVHDIAEDCRFALRLAWKERALTASATVVLALGLAVNNTLFTIASAHCIRGLGVPHADRMVYLATADANGIDGSLTFPEFDALQSASTLAAVAGFETAGGTLVDDTMAADRVMVAYVSSGLLQTMSEQPILGRGLAPLDDRPGAQPVVLISEALWKTRYRADPSILGTPTRVAGVSATIVGVLRGEFRFPNNSDVWLPLSQGPSQRNPAASARSVEAVGLLAEGSTLEQARDELGALWRRVQTGAQSLSSAPLHAKVSLIDDTFNAKLTSPIWLAFVTVGFLLVLIACFNVANLLLARSVRRQHEMSIRRSLGASRARIVRQVLVESALLAGSGGALGLILSRFGLHLFASAIPQDGLPYWVHYTMDGRVLGVLSAVCLGTLLLFGLAPALHAAGGSTIEALKVSAPGATHSRRVRRWTAVLLTLQLAVSVMLLSAVAGSVRAFLNANRGLRIEGAGLVTMRLELPSDRYPAPSQRRDLYRMLNERLHAIPAVSSVTLAGALPGTGGPLRKLAIEGRDGGPAAAPLIQTISVDRDYFATAGIALSDGRSFTDTDGLPGRPVAIVNEQFTRAYFKDASPIGRRIALSEPDGPPGPWLTIVGVSPTVRQGTPLPVPGVYVPLSFAPVPSPVILVRTRDTPPSIGEAAREAVRRIDSTLAIYRVQSFEQASREARWNARLSTLLITSVALIALGLSSAGLWSLSWHGVAVRRQEIGVRMALGSQPEQITTLILSAALRQVASGAAFGCLLTLVWERLFATPHTLFTLTNLLIVNAFLAVMALAMCLWPARYASRSDPLTAIRHE